MHLLPLSVAKVSACADKKDSTRFALSGVHIVLEPDNRFLVEATDSKRLLRVSGECPFPADEFPHSDLHRIEADPTKREFLCPAATWDKAFKMLKPRAAAHKPILGSVGLVLEKQEATFGMTDLDSMPTIRTREIEGRYPPTNDIVRQTARQAKTVAFSADPKLMADALNAMAAMMGESKRVDVLVGPPDKPFLMRATGENGVLIECLMMPLYPDEPVKPKRAAKTATPIEEPEPDESDDASPSDEPLPKLDEDQRREPDADPHACVKCHEIDCVCEPVAEDTDLDDEPTEVDPKTVKSIPIVFECLTA